MPTLLEFLTALTTDEIILYIGGNFVNEQTAIFYQKCFKKFGLVTFENLPTEHQNNLLKTFFTIYLK